jgi:hypothetical protein
MVPDVANPAVREVPDRRAMRQIRNDITRLLEERLLAYAGLGKNRMKRDD